MATSDSPLSVPNVTLAVARGASTAPALTGGTSALSYSIAALSRDAEVTIATDGTYNFGQYGPELIALMEAPLATDATGRIGPDNGVRLGPSVSFFEGSLPLEVDARLPGGMGWVVGSKNVDGLENLNSEGVVGRMRMTHGDAARGFESRLIYMPEDNVQQIYRYLVSEEDALPPGTDTGFNWQIKQIWNMSFFNDTGGATASDLTDFYYTDFSTKLGRTTPFRDYGSMASNDGFSQSFFDDTIVRHNSGGIARNFVMRQIGASNEYKVPLDEPYMFEFSYDQGDVSVLTDGHIESRVVSESIGEHLYARKTGIRIEPSTSSKSEINHFTYPGYVIGYNSEYNCHFISGDLYKTKGTGPNNEGAWARACISDAADFTAATKITYLEPVQNGWGSTQAKFKLRGGWWSLDSLAGKYLCLIGDDNQQIGTGVQL